MRILVAVLCGIFLWHSSQPRTGLGQSTDKLVRPLKNAYAHNDYLHSRPLLDALANGFCSVEADIFLRHGELLVAHTQAEIVETRTLEALYLEPLRQRIRKNGGNVYPDGSPLLLLIDIKSAGNATYTVLDNVLASYADILTHSLNGNLTKRPVSVVVSGNRPINMILADTTRYAAIDGRLADLNGSTDPALMPLISDNWNIHFQWRGTGNMSEQELIKLREIVLKTHESRRMLRFWGTPDIRAMWSLLQHEKVDFINTDNLQGLRQYLDEANTLK